MMRTYLLFVYNMMVWCIRKVHWGSRYHVDLLERFHPSVRLSLFGSSSSIKIARNVEIARDGEILVFDDACVEIGEGCYFNNRLMISCHAGICIGEGCLFGPDVKLFDNNHVFSRKQGVSTLLSSLPINIGSHCWIASNVVILKGATIGDNCVIGAGCVISGTIPSGSIVKQKADGIVIEKIN